MKIETVDLSYVYPGGVHALKDINFKANSECIAVLGPNGAGKSTLLQHFNGLLTPTSGYVYLDGKKVDGSAKRMVGMLFQNPDDQLFEVTVDRDIAYAPRNFGVPEGEIPSIVRKSLYLVHLSGFEKRQINTLSYGEKKRVAIAGLLAADPEVLVLDEPTSALDPKTASDLIEMLLRMRKKSGLTMIIATHDVDSIPLFADRVYVLNRGRITLEGTPREVFWDKDRLRKSGLRLPRIAHLFEVMGKKEMPLTIGEARRALEDGK